MPRSRVVVGKSASRRVLDSRTRRPKLPFGHDRPNRAPALAWAVMSRGASRSASIAQQTGYRPCRLSAAESLAGLDLGHRANATSGDKLRAREGIAGMNKSTKYLIVVAIVGTLAAAMFFLARHPALLQSGGDLLYAVSVPVDPTTAAPAEIAPPFLEFYGTGYDAAIPSESNIAYSVFVADVEKNAVRNVSIQGHSIAGGWTNGKKFRTYAPDDPSLIGRLTAHGVAISATPDAYGSSLRELAINGLPLLLLAGASI